MKCLHGEILSTLTVLQNVYKSKLYVSIRCSVNLVDACKINISVFGNVKLRRRVWLFPDLHIYLYFQMIRSVSSVFDKIGEFSTNMTELLPSLPRRVQTKDIQSSMVDEDQILLEFGTIKGDVSLGIIISAGSHLIHTAEYICMFNILNIWCFFV